MTRCQDYFSILGHLQQWKFGPKAYQKFAKVCWRFFKIINKPSYVNGQRLYFLTKVEIFRQTWSHWALPLRPLGFFEMFPLWPQLKRTSKNIRKGSKSDSKVSDCPRLDWYRFGEISPDLPTIFPIQFILLSRTNSFLLKRTSG